MRPLREPRYPGIPHSPRLCGLRLFFPFAPHDYLIDACSRLSEIEHNRLRDPLTGLLGQQIVFAG